MKAESRIEARLLREISRLNREHRLIEAGDRVMVAISGGKDSWALLHLLRAYRRGLPFDFEIVAMNLDQGQPGFDRASMQAHLEHEGFAYHFAQQDTYSVVLDKTPAGKTYCSLCSRLRRGVLYRVAGELGATKIALGHHADDAIETLLLNQFYAGQIKSMPPRLRSDDGQHVIIRPLMASLEAEIGAYAAEREVPILPCDLCGSQEGLKRKAVKRWIGELQEQIPDLRRTLLASLSNVVPSHLHDLQLRADLGALGEDEAAESSEEGRSGELVQLRRLAGRLAGRIGGPDA